MKNQISFNNYYKNLIQNSIHAHKYLFAEIQAIISQINYVQLEFIILIMFSLV